MMVCLVLQCFIRPMSSTQTWRNGTLLESRGGLKTSGIAALPLHASSALDIYLYFVQYDANKAHTFLLDAFDAVYRWHNYLYSERDADGDGLVYIRRSRCLLYTSPSPRDKRQSRMPSSA